MKHTLRYFSILGLLLLTTISLSAQNRRGESVNDGVRGYRRSSLTININARVVEENRTVIWNQTENKNTIPGRPVGINLVGSNVVVAVQLTPFIRRAGNVLVAQGQIWIEDPEKGISYHASIQTIPMEFGEPIHFFPLGTSSQSSPSIEIIITVNPETVSNEQ